MIEIEDALEDCLTRLGAGASLNECLALYPQYAKELSGLLSAAQRAQTGQAMRPAPAFKTRTRAEVLAYARAHPRRQPSWLAGLFSNNNLRVTLSIAGLALAFVALGTGVAQAALPGDVLYNWKLASEQTWRAVSPDHFSVDLALSKRRATELEQVAGQQEREDLARAQYQRSLNVLLTYTGAEARQTIALELVAQQQRLEQAKVYVTALDLILFAIQTPPVTAIPIPSMSATLTLTASVIETSTPMPTLPQATAANTRSPATTLPNLVATLVPTVLPSSLPPVLPTDLPIATLAPTSLPALATDLPHVVDTLVPDPPQIQVTLPALLPTP